ncbi:MAG: hypothetical protein P1Q69_10265 [Candidatus Thorarchaeota archaeon]|nr:hypothetical protein [Candidatus Thorarchaeota archaeon]
MDRIETGSEVHSTSINDDDETGTLHEMVTVWAEQPWDGVQYKRIAESLWNSIEDLTLIEGPYGMSVTLLESCIVDSVEGIDAGLFQAEQAVNNLKKLLETDDFVEGARIIEVYVKTNPVCRISNANQLLHNNQSIDYRKPKWWTRSVRSYWIIMGAVSFVSMIIIYGLMINLGLWLPEYLILSITIGPPMYALSYYMRTILTKRRWRAVYIILGAGGIGFWFLAWPMVLLFGPTIRLMPVWLRFPVTMIMPPVVGAYIGDRLGKRRDYLSYM